MRILLVAHDRIAPAPTGSGNRVIRWGLIDGFRRSGAVPAFYSAGPVGRNAAEFAAAQASLGRVGCRIWYGQPGLDRLEEAGAALAQAIDAFLPDVVLAYGIEPLRIARASGFCGLVALYSQDLEFLPSLYRHVYNLRFGRAKQKIKSTLLTPKILLDAGVIYFRVRRDYPKADAVITISAQHGAWHASRHGRPIIYTPMPLAPIFEANPPRRPASPPRFVLLGGIGGIATLTGLAWFARKAYPLLEPAIIRGELEVHLVGRGELAASLDQRMPHLVRRGYVEDLAEDFATATALLVPTPINVGSRTRIFDAFRHGLPVVAHAANSFGSPEFVHEKNALLAPTPEGFAAAVLQLARDRAQVERLSAAAFADFCTTLSGVAVARQIADFIRSLGGTQAPAVADRHSSHAQARRG